MYVAAESISDEKKRPDLLVVELSAVLSRLGLLEAVEGSRHCVACRSGRATGSDENNGSFIPTKRSFGRVSVGAPETEPPCMHHTTAPSLATVPGRAVLVTPIGPTTDSTTISHASVRSTAEFLLQDDARVSAGLSTRQTDPRRH